MGSELMKVAALGHIRKLIDKLNMEYNTQYNIVFYTASGKIVCDLEPIAKGDSLLGFTDDPTSFTVDISAVFDEKDMFDSCLINARNVIFYNQSGEGYFSAEQVVLFADQILGFGIEKKCL